jgi:hypothetical protein
MEVGIGGEHSHAAYLLTDSYASAAQDAEVVITIEERLS